MTPKQLIDQHNAAVQRAAADLQDSMSDVAKKAVSAVIVYLLARLVTRDGKILATADNAKLLSQVADLLNKAMVEAGLDSALADFSSQFDLQVGAYQTLLQTLRMPVAELPASSERFLSEHRVAITLSFLGLAHTFASDMRDRALLAINQTTNSLTSELLNHVDRISAAFEREASSSLFEHYRLAGDILTTILATTTRKPVLFVYDGPSAADPKIRPFCAALMSQAERGKVWTRAEINELDNGMLPNVFVTCGGFNCRHQWRPTNADHGDVKR
jgi:hypothetical protein